VVALRLSDSDKARYDLRARRIVEAAGVVLGHHVLAIRSAGSIDQPGHLDVPVRGVGTIVDQESELTVLFEGMAFEVDDQHEYYKTSCVGQLVASS
jgi:hypothetical protein